MNCALWGSVRLRATCDREPGGQETSTTPTIDPKSLKDRARLPTPSEMDATSIGALNADATVLDAAIQQARIGSVLRPVQRLAPGILDWARARVLRALHGGATFTSISQAQEWLGHEIAQNFHNPKVGYTFEIRRVLADLLGGIVLSRLHRALYRGNEGEKPAPRPLTSRTSATPAPDSKSDRVRLPTPSEFDDWPGLDEALQGLLAEKRAKERMQEKYPTAAALVMARAMQACRPEVCGPWLSAEGEVPGVAQPFRPPPLRAVSIGPRVKSLPSTMASPSIRHERTGSLATVLPPLAANNTYYRCDAITLAPTL